MAYIVKNRVNYTKQVNKMQVIHMEGSGVGRSANDVAYNNSNNLLKSATMQDAIDELAGMMRGIILEVPTGQAWDYNEDENIYSIVIELPLNFTSEDLSVSLYNDGGLSDNTIYFYNSIITSIKAVDNGIEIKSTELPENTFKLMVSGKAAVSAMNKWIHREVSGEFFDYKLSRSLLMKRFFVHSSFKKIYDHLSPIVITPPPGYEVTEDFEKNEIMYLKNNSNKSYLMNIEGDGTNNTITITFSRSAMSEDFLFTIPEGADGLNINILYL